MGLCVGTSQMTRPPRPLSLPPAAPWVTQAPRRQGRSSPINSRELTASFIQTTAVGRTDFETAGTDPAQTSTFLITY